MTWKIISERSKAIFGPIDLPRRCPNCLEPLSYQLGDHDRSSGLLTSNSWIYSATCPTNNCYTFEKPFIKVVNNSREEKFYRFDNLDKKEKEALSYVIPLHEHGEHRAEYCLPRLCETVRENHKNDDHSLCGARCNVIKALHSSEDHTRCHPFFCKTLEKSHKKNHALCHEDWCDRKYIIDKRKQNHDSGDHSLCLIESCKEITESHNNGDHALCWFPQCPVRGEIDSAHRNKRHSHHCNSQTCSVLKDHHDKNDHSLCFWNSCEPLKKSHESGVHNLCTAKKCEIKENHDRGQHSEFCDSRTCFEARTLHEKENHSLCSLISCYQMDKSHRNLSHALCTDRSCDIKRAHNDGPEVHSSKCDHTNCAEIKKHHDASDHSLCLDKICKIKPWSQFIKLL